MKDKFQTNHSLISPHTWDSVRVPQHVMRYLHREFCRWFSDFENIDKSLQLVSCPLSQDSETAQQELQMELIYLQCDSVLREKFNSLKLDEFYASLSTATFPNIL